MKASQASSAASQKDRPYGLDICKGCPYKERIAMNIENATQLAEYKTVQTWLKNVHHQSPASTTSDQDRLSTLLKFCQFVEKDPDTIIAECFRAQKEGDEWKHIKFKVRRSYSATIKQVEDELFGGGVVGQQQGNIIRSFFIHNGVFMQAEPLL